MHSTVRTSTRSASQSVGGRVCAVRSLASDQGPIVSASRTTIQPDCVIHVVSTMFVPGS
jgi:carbonic anhydrase/acetyltransferase-like protein (isoleucine patch superfamily)